MAFVSLNNDGSNRFEVILTELGASYLAMGKGNKINVNFFSLSDYEINYLIAQNVNSNTNFTNVPTIGKLSTLTGVESKVTCIPKVSDFLNNRQSTLTVDESFTQTQEAPIEFTIILPTPLFNECEITVP